MSKLDYMDDTEDHLNYRLMDSPEEEKPRIRKRKRQSSSAHQECIASDDEKVDQGRDDEKHSITSITGNEAKKESIEVDITRKSKRNKVTSSDDIDILPSDTELEESVLESIPAPAVNSSKGVPASNSSNNESIAQLTTAKSTFLKNFLKKQRTNDAPAYLDFGGHNDTLLREFANNVAVTYDDEYKITDDNELDSLVSSAIANQIIAEDEKAAASIGAAGTAGGIVKPSKKGDRRFSHNPDKNLRYFLGNTIANLKCHNCGLLGHKMHDCPRPPIHTVFCHLCAGSDHDPGECSNIVCFRCSTFGHHSRNCPNTRGLPRTIVCTICGSLTHDLVKCPTVEDNLHGTRHQRFQKHDSFDSNDAICMICHEKGHISCCTNVPQIPDLDTIYCPNCGDASHHVDFPEVSRCVCTAPKMDAYLKIPKLLRDMEIVPSNVKEYYQSIAREERLYPDQIDNLFPLLCRTNQEYLRYSSSRGDGGSGGGYGSSSNRDSYRGGGGEDQRSFHPGTNYNSSSSNGGRRYQGGSGGGGGRVQYNTSSNHNRFDQSTYPPRLSQNNHSSSNRQQSNQRSRIIYY